MNHKELVFHTDYIGALFDEPGSLNIGLESFEAEIVLGCIFAALSEGDIGAHGPAHLLRAMKIVPLQAVPIPRTLFSICEVPWV